MKLFLKSLLTSSVILSASAFAAELSYKVYNPQAQGIFPVTSTLISGEKDAVLVDASFMGIEEVTAAVIAEFEKKKQA